MIDLGRQLFAIEPIERREIIVGHALPGQPRADVGMPGQGRQVGILPTFEIIGQQLNELHRSAAGQRSAGAKPGRQPRLGQTLLEIGHHAFVGRADRDLVGRQSRVPRGQGRQHGVGLLGRSVDDRDLPSIDRHRHFAPGIDRQAAMLVELGHLLVGPKDQGRHPIGDLVEHCPLAAVHVDRAD